jgi:metal-responsive CopG/Arc/MetJ family transcriptional regulator
MCIALNKELLARLDAVATANGVTRSDIVRAAIFQEVAVQEAILSAKAKASDVGRSYIAQKTKVDEGKKLAKSIEKVIAGYVK